MANTVRINAAALNRPGVFVSQSSTGGLPQPIATHAVGYIFGTTQGDEYYQDQASNLTYSPLLPYEPTQIASAEDFVLKTGGSIPSSNSGALVSYDSVKAFFDNVGINGILYFTRVSPTPETVVDIGVSEAGAGFTSFALKVNGRYFGTPTGIYDNEQVEIKIIRTTGLDKFDNARDLYQFLAGSSVDSDNFSDFYRVEQTAPEALAGKFRIFSKDVTNLPEVEALRAYNFDTNDYAGSGIDLLNEAGVIRFYTSVKELNFRCTSRDVDTGEAILFVSGSALSQYIKAANDDTPGTYNPATDQSLILEEFLVSQKIYASMAAVPDMKIVAVSKDLSNNFAPGNTWPSSSAAYWVFDSGSSAGSYFTVKEAGGNKLVPSGTVSLTGSVYTRAGYLPDTVQAFYLNIAGENRVVIINGATPDELTTSLRDEIQAVLVEKELNRYFDVEAVGYDPDHTFNTPQNHLYVPNNGYMLSNLVENAGAPLLRPDMENITLSGTVAISGADVTGTGTKFTKEIAPGAHIVVGGTRFAIATVVSDTQATVTPTDQNVSAGATATLDKSMPNGFYSHDYVLKIKITSKNGINSPVIPGKNRFGATDPNVVRLISQSQDVGYESYKLTQKAKAQDFVFAIEEGMGGKDYFAPGFVLAPEAYAILVSNGSNDDISSKGEARQERLKITQSLTALAEGRIGQAEGLTGTQHIALIDVGGDEVNLPDAQDELNLIKSIVGVPFGHASYYAPFVKNLNDRYVPPSGFIAGIACSRYNNEGFQQPPAGSRYPLRGATGLKFEISAQQQEVTYALGLNPIRSLPNRGIVAWGARTMSSNSLFKFVNTRAILNVLIDVLNRSFDDALFEQIDSAGTLYSRVKSIATQVLNQFYRQGALFGARPEQAYSVSCSSANNDNNLLESGTVRTDIYVATSPTLERLAITVVRTPAGQVSLISDSFSRNEQRYTNLLNTSSNFL